MFLGAYPITPASDVLHEVARFRHFGVKTFQAEDEIAAISASIGASFAGHLAVTTTSGPGMVLKQETLGLAVMTELPLVVVDIQRSGPSTGHAHEDRAGRSAARAVRAQQREPGARAGAEHAGRLLLHDARGVPARGPVHDPRDRAVGFLPRQQRRAVVDSRPRQPRPLPGALPHRRGGLPTLRARPGDARAAVGDPGHARARAPDRRALEAGEHRQRLVRPGEPRAHDRAARGEGGADRRGASAGRGDRRRSRRSARGGLGRHARRDPRRPWSRRAPTGSRWRRSTCAT